MNAKTPDHSEVAPSSRMCRLLPAGFASSVSILGTKPQTSYQGYALIQGVVGAPRAVPRFARTSCW